MHLGRYVSTVKHDVDSLNDPIDAEEADGDTYLDRPDGVESGHILLSSCSNSSRVHNASSSNFMILQFIVTTFSIIVSKANMAKWQEFLRAFNMYE